MKNLILNLLFIFLALNLYSQSDKFKINLGNLEVKNLNERTKFSMSKKQLLKITLLSKKCSIDSVKFIYEFNKEFKDSKYKPCYLNFNKKNRRIAFYLFDNKCVDLNLLKSHYIRNIWIFIKIKNQNSYEQYSFELVPE